jgi:ribose transport system substrate-binding protein
MDLGSTLSNEGSKGRGHRMRVKFTPAVVVVVLASMIAGVGGVAVASGSTNTGRSAGVHATVKPNDLTLSQLMKELLNPASLPFAKPNQKFKPGKHKVAVISADVAGAGAATLIPFIDAAIKAIGWPVPKTGNGNLSPTTESSLIEQAVNGGAKGIILIAVTSSAVSAALQLAKAKHVPVVCANCGPNNGPGAVPGVIESGGSSVLQGEAQGAYVAQQLLATGGNVIAFNDNEFYQDTVQIGAAVQAVNEYCSKCTVEEENTNTTEVFAPGVPFFAAFLAANPVNSVQWIITPYDPAAAPFATEAQQEGRTEINFMGYGGLQPFVADIQAGSPVGAKADILVPIPYESWAAVDLLARAISHLKLWNANSLPAGIYDQSNYKQFNLTAPFLNPPFNYQAFFKAQWER